MTDRRKFLKTVTVGASALTPLINSGVLAQDATAALPAITSLLLESPKLTVTKAANAFSYLSTPIVLESSASSATRDLIVLPPPT